MRPDARTPPRPGEFAELACLLEDAGDLAGAYLARRAAAIPGPAERAVLTRRLDALGVRFPPPSGRPLRTPLVATGRGLRALPTPQLLLVPTETERTR